MKNSSLNIVVCVFLAIALIIPVILASSTAVSTNQKQSVENPIGDVQITVKILKIRSLEKKDPQVLAQQYIDKGGKPDFYVKIFITDQEFTSPTWDETSYLYNTPFSATAAVPSEIENVTVKIQLWDWNADGDQLCDIRGAGSGVYDVTLQYSLHAGHWIGDDFFGDPSGYGRLNGCDDGKIYRSKDRDCELWFTITQPDPDGDGIPTWMETNVYGTNPDIDNTGEDSDGDGCPIEWEWRWGYDPLQSDEHSTLDPDIDGLNNVEEYRTAQWWSDPFRKDLFVELDQMAEGPNGETSIFPDASKEILNTAYDRYNIVYHLDDGSWEGTGSEIVPFEASTSYSRLIDIYNAYFLHGDENNWRRGVFHYGILIYNCDVVGGMAFGANRFQISSILMEKKAKLPFLNRDVVYASAYMHESGHTLITGMIGGHNSWSKYPWQIGWWIWHPYKSCMNYGYMYTTVDYSDGSRPFFDFNDWSPQRMDLTSFQRSW